MSWFTDFLTDTARQAAPGIHQGINTDIQRKQRLDEMQKQIPIEVERQKAMMPGEIEKVDAISRAAQARDSANQEAALRRAILLQHIKNQGKVQPEVPMGPIPPPSPGMEWQRVITPEGKVTNREVRTPEKKPTTGETSTIPGLEFLASQKAIPFDLTNPEERSAYSSQAAQAGMLTPAQALQHSRPPIERVPLSFGERGPYEAFNKAIKEGKSLEEATEIGERIRNEIRESGSVATAAGSERGKQRPDVPLRIRDLLLFGKPVGTTYGQLQGNEPATPQMREEVTQLDNAGAILDTLKGLADRLVTAKSPVDAYTQAAKLHVGAMTRGNETAASYQDTKQMFLGVLSRTLGGERGVLTDKDISRVVRGLPDFRDTAGLKDFKLGALRAILNVASDAKMRVITASPPDPKFRQRLEQMLISLDSGKAGAQPPQGIVPPSRATQTKSVPKLDENGLSVVRGAPAGKTFTIGGQTYTREELLGGR